MNTRTNIIIALLLVLPFCLEAQRWKRERHELFAGFGSSNILAELGGADKLGSNFITDLDYSLTRPAFSAGYRYRIAKSFVLKGAFSYLRVNGDDRLTKEDYRQNRNLHFRSGIIELSPQLEWYFMKEDASKRYRLRGIRGKLNLSLGGYLYIGVAGFYFNPKAKYDGEWHALQPLGTEGQGLDGNKKKYSRISFGIPVGFGFKYKINNKFGLNLDYGYRFTFTDYIDDVSTTYYNNDLIRSANGDVAAALADPSLGMIIIPDGITVTGHGQQRGQSKNNDAYMMATLGISYKLVKSRSSRPKF